MPIGFGIYIIHLNHIIMERKLHASSDLLANLEAVGFSWQGYGTDKSMDRKSIENGFSELDRFFRLASMLRFRSCKMMVCTCLDRDFWHPMIAFLDECYPYGYRGFCTQYYGCDIPHKEGEPDRNAYFFTIDMMQKAFGIDSISSQYWKQDAELPDCTKSPILI